MAERLHGKLLGRILTKNRKAEGRGFNSHLGLIAIPMRDGNLKITLLTVWVLSKGILLLACHNITETFWSVCMRQLSKEIYADKDFVEKYINAQRNDEFHQFEDKPAIHKMLGNIKGKSVLCIGCGNGDECAYIKGKGAKEVTGVDLSESMIEKARNKHKGIKFYAMSAAKLRFRASEFDVLYADLVLHYMSDISPAMNEAYRVLKSGGRFVFSEIHPIYSMLERSDKKGLGLALFGYVHKGKKYEVLGDYFAHSVYSSEWFKGNTVKSYAKTFSELIMPAVRAGFTIKSVTEPKPLESLRKLNPERYKKLSKVPQAIIIELVKPG